MRARILLRLVLVILPTIGLMLIWLAFLPRLGQASSPAAIAQPAGEQAPTQAPTPAPTPDPRWVEIVRTRDSANGAAPDASLPTINLNLTDGYVAGRVPSPVMVEIAITDQGQVIASRSVLPVPEEGGFYYSTYLGYYEGHYLSPDYVVEVTQGAAATSMTVPALTSLAYPQTDVLSGTAPANADLLAYLFPAASPGVVYTSTTTAGGYSAYQLDWAPAVDLRPQDSGYILYTQDPGRQAYTRFVAPILRPQVGGSGISGAAAPNSTVDIVVEDAAGEQVGSLTAYANSDGDFCGGGGGEGGGYHADFTISPTDRVTAVAGGQTFSMTVITLTAQADRQAGQVWGQAPASRPVEVLRFAGPASNYGECFLFQQPLSQEIVTATADGGYTVALPLEAANYGAALATTPDGNQVYARYAVPYMHVTLGKTSRPNYRLTRIWGQVAEPSVPITVEVQGPSGYLKDWYMLTASGSGYFYDQEYSNLDLTIESGDLVTLTTPHTPPVSLLLPVLTAAVDINTGIVSGQAPPFSQVVVSAGYIIYNWTLTATADAEGQYSVDFSGLGGFDDYVVGDAEWTSMEGYHAARHFEAGGGEICPPRIEAAQVGGNMVHFQSSYGCGEFTFRLRGADGVIKAESSYINYNGTYGLEDDEGRPILILTGDQLELEYFGQAAATLIPIQQPVYDSQQPLSADGQVETAVVPVLTVSLDPQADQAYGQAPPGAVIDLMVDWDTLLLTTTASAQGAYHFDLAGLVDLQAGSELRIAIQGQPYFYTLGLLPVINASLYNLWMYGVLPPLVPYTITLSSPGTVITQVTGYVDSSGSFQTSLYPPPEGNPFPKPGDLLKVETPDRFWQMIFPWLTAHVDTSTGVISGEAPPDSRLAVYLDFTENPSSSQIVTATASGMYSASFPILDVLNMHTGYVQHFTTEDMRTILHFGRPHWYVTLGSRQVDGYAPMTGIAFTVTLQSSDGIFNQSIYTTTLGYTNYFQVQFQRAIQPGDRLSLQTVDGQVSEFTVPYLSAVHDFARRVLEGRAPADGELIAYIPISHDRVSRHIRLGPGGRYGVDTSDLNTIVGMSGEVFFIDRFGNTVTRPFTIRGYPCYLPLIRLLASP